MNYFLCGGKPFKTKTRNVTFSHTAEASDSWYGGSLGMTFDFPEKLIAITSVEVIGSSGSYFSAQGANISNILTQYVIAYWVYARSQTQSCTVRVTAIGY